MRIFVKVKTGAKEEKVVEPEPKLLVDINREEYYTVHTKEKPERGRATEDVARLLARHFSVARSSVRLVSGATSRKKVFSIG